MIRPLVFQTKKIVSSQSYTVELGVDTRRQVKPSATVNVLNIAAQQGSTKKCFNICIVYAENIRPHIPRTYPFSAYVPPMPTPCERLYIVHSRTLTLLSPINLVPRVTISMKLSTLGHRQRSKKDKVHPSEAVKHAHYRLRAKAPPTVPKGFDAGREPVLWVAVDGPQECAKGFLVVLLVLNLTPLLVHASGS